MRRKAKASFEGISELIMILFRREGAVVVERASLVIALALVGGQGSNAATIVVPDDFLTIQAAIDFAAPDDSVLVRPGTYVETLLIGKSLSLIASNGPEVTIIDGAAPTRPDTLSVVCGLAPERLVLDGFTIRNGGGGSSFQDLPAESGSGIYMYGGAGTIRNCIVADNFCNGNGGGIYLAASVLSLVDCVVRTNHCVGSGGGVASLLCSPVIERCVFEGNYGETDNGAMRLEVGSPEIRDCIIKNNRTDVGFAVFAGDLSHEATIMRTVFTGNSGDTPSRIGCVSFAGLMEQCTITGNDVQIALSMAGRLSKTIIAGNGGEAIRCASALEVECSDVFGNALSNDLCGIDLGGNFSSDPLFCADLSIASTSPCAPEHSPNGCGLIGALGVTCAAPVEQVTWGWIKASMKGR